MVRIELDEKIAIEIDKDNIEAQADPSRIDLDIPEGIDFDIGYATVNLDPDTTDKIFTLAASEWIRAANKTIRRRGKSRGWNWKPLTKSWKVEANETGRGYEAIVRNTHPAASYWNDGTEEHVIEANEADALKIPWPDAPPGVETTDDGYIFRKRVEVGGLDPMFFQTSGSSASKKFLRQNIEIDGRIVPRSL